MCFAGNRSVLSKPLLGSDTSIPTYVSLLVGLPIAASLMIPSGEVASLRTVPLIVVAIFIAVGIFHYTVGRQLSFVAVKNIGANQTAPILSTSIIYSVLLAILLLNERLTATIGLATALIVAGIMLLEAGASAKLRGGSYKVGYTAAILCGFIFGLTPVLIREGLLIYNYFASTLFIAYVAGTVCYAIAIAPRKFIRSIRETPTFALIGYVLSAIFGAGGQILRFAALSFAPVLIVAPILVAHPVFTVLMTRRLARELEIFRLRTIIAIITVIAGTLILALFTGVGSLA